MTPETVPDRTDRDAILALLADTIEATHAQAEAVEPTTTENQELQIKWIRTLGYLAGQYRKLLNDEELDELAAELDLLKADDGGRAR